MLSIGVVLGCILGVVFRINYFASPVWIFLVVAIFGLMYLKPQFLTVGMCLIAGMVMAFFRVAYALSSDAETKIGVDAVTEEMVLGARDWFSERIDKVLPEREARLGVSYLLGIKSGIDEELSENLKAVGLTHIVVASGAHLSILVTIARKIFGKISRFAGLLFSILFILFFMCMVGWTPSILRAGIMAIMTLISWYVGRKIAPLRLIIIVVAFTLMLEPTFITNLGWLLSFASYTGIMLVGPELVRFFYGNKKPKFVASLTLTTISATIMTLPITLYYFGQISIISIIANLLILPTLPYAMGLVFFAGVFSGVPFVGTAVGFLVTKLLDFHIMVVSMFAGMEQFLVVVEPYNPWVFLIYFPIFGVMGYEILKKLLLKK